MNLEALLVRAAAGVGVRWRLPFAEVRQAVLGPAGVSGSVGSEEACGTGLGTGRVRLWL